MIAAMLGMDAAAFDHELQQARDAVIAVFDRLLAPARREANRAAELAAGGVRRGRDIRRRPGGGRQWQWQSEVAARMARSPTILDEDCARRIEALRDSRRYRLASNDTRDRIERLIVKSVDLGPTDADDARVATWIGRLCDFLEATAGRPAYLTPARRAPEGLRAPAAHHFQGEVGGRLPADASGGARRTPGRAAACAVRQRALGARAARAACRHHLGGAARLGRRGGPRARRRAADGCDARSASCGGVPPAGPGPGGQADGGGPGRPVERARRPGAGDHHRPGLVADEPQASRAAAASRSSPTASSAARNSATRPTSTSCSSTTTTTRTRCSATRSSRSASPTGCPPAPRPASCSRSTCGCARTAAPGCWSRACAPSSSTRRSRRGSGSTRR